MNPEKDREFESNMNQLVKLLKKLLKNLPGQPPFTQFQGKSGEAPMYLNFCFFNFLPFGPEEFDALEDAYEQSLFPEERSEELNRGLTPSDIEFLRRNGIRF